MTMMTMLLSHSQSYLAVAVSVADSGDVAVVDDVNADTHFAA